MCRGTSQLGVVLGLARGKEFDSSTECWSFEIHDINENAIVRWKKLRFDEGEAVADSNTDSCFGRHHTKNCESRLCHEDTYVL